MRYRFIKESVYMYFEKIIIVCQNEDGYEYVQLDHGDQFFHRFYRSNKLDKLLFYIGEL